MFSNKRFDSDIEENFFLATLRFSTGNFDLLFNTGTVYIKLYVGNYKLIYVCVFAPQGLVN